MAAKMKCPSCGFMLKEQGDQGKRARGEYQIYDCIPFGPMTTPVYTGEGREPLSYRVLKCLPCGFFGSLSQWLDF